jgi:hypothetical protein
MGRRNGKPQPRGGKVLKSEREYFRLMDQFTAFRREDIEKGANG